MCYNDERRRCIYLLCEMMLKEKHFLNTNQLLLLPHAPPHYTTATHTQTTPILKSESWKLYQKLKR